MKRFLAICVLASFSTSIFSIEAYSWDENISSPAVKECIARFLSREMVGKTDYYNPQDLDTSKPDISAKVERAFERKAYEICGRYITSSTPRRSFSTSRTPSTTSSSRNQALRQIGKGLLIATGAIIVGKVLESVLGSIFSRSSKRKHKEPVQTNPQQTRFSDAPESQFNFQGIQSQTQLLENMLQEEENKSLQLLKNVNALMESKLVMAKIKTLRKEIALDKELMAKVEQFKAEKKRQYIKEALAEAESFKAANSIESVTSWSGDFFDKKGREVAHEELKTMIKQSIEKGEPVYIVTQSKGAEIAYSVLSEPDIKELIQVHNADVILMTLDTNKNLLVDGRRKATEPLNHVEWINVHYSPRGLSLEGARGDPFGAPIPEKLGVRNVELSEVPGVERGHGWIPQQHAFAYQPENIDALVLAGKIPSPKGSLVIAVPGTDPRETFKGRIKEGIETIDTMNEIYKGETAQY